MYEVASDEAWELFGAHLNGAPSALVCVLSEAPLDDRSRSALESAANSLGYGPSACAFASLRASDGDEGELDERAYRCEVALDKPGRAFGRSMVAFKSFAAMLDDAQDKQVAWALLKKLPRFGER